MKHIVKILHRLTEDQKGVYYSCEENGTAIFVSDLKHNGTFHYTGREGAMLSLNSLHLFRAYTQEKILSFVPDASGNKYSGMFYGNENVPCGNIGPIGTGSGRYYVANLYGIQYECYIWTVGTAPCMMFYRDGIQVAALVEDKISVNQMYSMTMHIIDDENLGIMCMLGLLYHEFENIRNMNSRFHRQFIRNGWSISFCENVANYHFEVRYKGIGKAKYNPDFIRQFYPEGYFPYDDSPVTAGKVFKEMGTGMQQACGQAWTKNNLKKSLKNPVAIALFVGMPILCGIIGGFIGWSFLLQFGFDITGFTFGIRFLIGFLTFFGMIALGEGLFLLLFLGIVSLFDKNK